TPGVGRCGPGPPIPVFPTAEQAVWPVAPYSTDHEPRRDIGNRLPGIRMADIPEAEGGQLAVTDEAIDKIKEMIVSGELGPGDRLPKEVDLADRLGLSRNSLREAVKALSLIHVLDVRQGDGTYVTSLEPRLLLDAISFVVEVHRDDTVLEILQVRRLLEPAATAMAAQHMTDAEVEELRDILALLDEEPTVEALVANDLEFHRRIAIGSGNTVLASLIDSLSGPTTRARIWRGL